MKMPGATVFARASRETALMTVDTVGGVWTYGIDLARGLAAEGVDVFLACIGSSITDDQAREAEEVAALGWEFRESRLEWMQDPWADVEDAARWLLDLESRLCPDIVHLNQFAYAAAGFRAPTLVVAHSCVWSWFEAVKDAEPGAEWQAYRDAVRAGLRAAAGVTAISETLLDGLERWYGGFRRLPAIRNGRELSSFAPRPKEPFVLAAGRAWDEAKNVALLDEIAPQLPWPIKVAGCLELGDGETEARIQNVDCLGRLGSAAMADAARAASIFASPALYEPFGLAILEAAAAGCALVLADIPSLRASWEGAALFAPPRNAKGWVNAIGSLIADEIARQHLGELARQRALSGDFSLPRMARAYRVCYDALLGERALARVDKIA